jgi:crotonobetainyl-CoA:carnitine CoA-transferase CaiB-like acyl-CoA transferase
MDQAEPCVMKPLQGIRIVSVEQYAAVPYGTMLLAALGADVIKIENPSTGGDPARYTGPHLLGESDSQYFQGWNLNKKSVALDLKSPEGRQDFEGLIRTADAVVNNLRGDQPAKLGLDYAALSRLKKSIICLHVSAYGRDNERAAWPGYDFLMQAEAGLMSITGEPDGPPTRFGPSQIDYMTGSTSMVGLLAALIGAQRTGQGCDVDVSLYDVALHQLGYAGTWYLNSGEAVTRQTRSGHFSVAPVQTFPTADGWIFVMCMTEKFWIALLGALKREDLSRDDRFSSVAARHSNVAALTAVLDNEFRTRTTGQWLELLSGVLPVGPVYDVREALESEFARRSGMIQTAPHPRKPDLKVLASPIKIDGSRGGAPAPCPKLGADNDELLSPLEAAGK